MNALHNPDFLCHNRQAMLTTYRNHKNPSRLTNFSLSGLAFLFLASCGSPQVKGLSSNSGDRPVEIAISFDHGPGPSDQLFSRAERMKELLRIIQEEQVPETVNFTTVKDLDTEQAVELLRIYQSHGNIIANHSFGHLAFSQVSLEDFKTDFGLAEKYLSKTFRLTNWYRYPFLDEGGSREKIDAFHDFLESSKYGLGYVTINTFDWNLRDMLEAAVNQKRGIDYEKLEKLYLRHLNECLDFYQKLGRDSLQEPLKHVLILHMSDVNTLFFRQLIHSIRDRGWKLIPVSDAYKNPLQTPTMKLPVTEHGAVADLAKSRGYAGKLNPDSLNTDWLAQRFENEAVNRNSKEVTLESQQKKAKTFFAEVPSRFRPTHPNNYKAEQSAKRVIAKLDHSPWPNKILNRAEFDRASRSEILMFLSVFPLHVDHLPLPLEMNVDTINSDSISKWLRQEQSELLRTYRAAAKSCIKKTDLGCGFSGHSFQELLMFAREFSIGLPAKFDSWRKVSIKFYLDYVREQARLASLFPNPTSEILPLSNFEVRGETFNDGEFLLTFDGGPSSKDGLTDRYAEYLRKKSISGYFFAQGDALESRLSTEDAPALRKLYQGHCLGSKGYEHRSHVGWDQWRASLIKTRDLVKTIFPNRPVALRPQFGEISSELIDFVKDDQKVAPIMWNIDSQDWQDEIDANQVALRTQKLMLLKRKGIVLFHDIQSKGISAVPRIVEFAKDANLRWLSGCSRVLRSKN